MIGNMEDFIMNIDVVERNIVGNSNEIVHLRKKIKDLSSYMTTVLISGETGTGKELVARGLHYSGDFSGKPFIAINCSTFTDELFTSELFGYKKGAFTDAKTDKEGLISSANGGSLFLDEVDSLSLKSQASLLRVLQESEYRPIGENKTFKINVRFIFATNSDLEDRIKKGLFRQDLYFRIFILSIHIPPLRERKSDIPLLAEHFIENLNSQYCQEKKHVTSNFMNYLINHEWTGNVRELENCIHRHYLLSDGELLDIQEQDFKTHKNTQNLNEIITETKKEDIDESIANISNIIEDEPNTLLNFSNAKKIAVERFEAKFVSRILYICEGNVTKAAKLCGKERRSFGKMVKKYNIKNNEINIL